MKDIRDHVHVYLVLIAAILIGIGGILSIWRMKGVEREMAAIHRNYETITDHLRTILGNHAILMEQNRALSGEADELLQIARGLPATR